MTRISFWIAVAYLIKFEERNTEVTVKNKNHLFVNKNSRSILLLIHYVIVSIDAEEPDLFASDLDEWTVPTGAKRQGRSLFAVAGRPHVNHVDREEIRNHRVRSDCIAMPIFDEEKPYERSN